MLKIETQGSSRGILEELIIIIRYVKQFETLNKLDSLL
jgi:hypothetical protein